VYNRAVLKISGEVLAGNGKTGVDETVLSYVSGEIAAARKAESETAVVIGGGNFWRGIEEKISFLSRVDADAIGMMATVMNSIALKSALEKQGVPAAVLSRIEVENTAEKYTPAKAGGMLAAGVVVIIAGGTGNPFFTTDTAAALAAAELKADVLLKATKVDGVYSEDPVKNPSAKKYDFLSYEEAITKKLAVMDLAAFSMCMENNIKIIVFNLKEKGSISKVFAGKKIGTEVTWLTRHLS